MKIKNWFALITAISTIGTTALATSNISDSFKNSFNLNPSFGSKKGVSLNGGTYNSTKIGNIFTQGQMGYNELPGKIGDNQNEGTDVSLIAGYEHANGFCATGSGKVWSGHYGNEGTRTLTNPNISERNDYSINTNETKNFLGASLESIIKGYVKLIGQYGQNINFAKTTGSDLVNNTQIYNRQTVDNQGGFIVTTQENFQNNTVVNTSTSLKDYYNNINTTLGIEGEFKKNIFGAEKFGLWGRLNNQKFKTEQEILQNLRQDNSGYVSVIIDDGTNVDTTIVPVSYSDSSNTFYRNDAETKNSDFSIGAKQTFNFGEKYLDISWDQTIGSKQKQINVDVTSPIYNFSEMGRYDGFVGKAGFGYSPQFTEFSISGTQGLDWLRPWNPGIVLKQNKKILAQERKYSDLLEKINRNVSITENQREQLQKNIKESYLKSIGEEEPAMDLGMSFGKDNGENFVKFGGGYHTPKYSIAGFIGNPKQGINAKYYFDKVGISGSLEYDNRENSTIASVGLTYN